MQVCASDERILLFPTRVGRTCIFSNKFSNLSNKFSNLEKFANTDMDTFEYKRKTIDKFANTNIREYDFENNYIRGL